MPSLGVFFSAVVIGYFIIPFFLSKENIRLYLSHTTSSESAWRDGLLKFITDRMRRITPNFVSLVGMILVLLLAYLFENEYNYGLIFFVTLLAGFSDMLDGSLARNTNRVTRLGTVLDVLRDVILAVVVSAYLILDNLLSGELFFWFMAGWIILGAVRSLEFKVSSDRIFALEEDYKFVLDRLRLFLYIAGILVLILTPLFQSLRTLGETLIITSVVISWMSLAFHSAHLRILREESLERRRM
ncbi:CDP-alcohol phosphatidyltransferase family protein [Candidatus Giovannonibacteria bacterium]|nr:CDP-alcohol phosphatidyltransferase family protein [Candidatus Giovannonibacteria bacterium]